MRRAVFFGLALGIPAVLLAADILAQLGWERDQFERGFVEFVAAENYVPLPRVPSAAKALGALQRKAAVEALGGQAKAYFASEGFKKRWIERHGGRYRDPNEAKQKAEEASMKKKARGQAQGQLAQMEQMIPMMPPEMQAKVRAELAKAKADVAKDEAREAKRGQGREAEDPGNPVPDARQALKASLGRFLKASEGIDYAAATSRQGYRVTFVNPAYESKPDTWKACFRAGKEATEAARTFARAWLAELN